MKAALGAWSLEQVVYLAVDVTDLHNGFILIRLALIYWSSACSDVRVWGAGTRATKGCCNWLC